MNDPKIYLAIDNCFAYKRWTTPDEWAKVISELGVHYVEASSDTELDPLYMGEAYLKKWVDEVKTAEEKYDIKIANLYSGHGSYSTLGLAHTDPGVQRHLIEDWFLPLLDTAKAVDAGVGFYAHGFDNSVLQDKELYERTCRTLIKNLIEINAHAKDIGLREAGLEQMYAPYMIPWTVDGTKDLIREVSLKSNKSFYLTEDLGHHNPKFVMPTKEEILLCMKRKGDIWLGTDKAYGYYSEALDHPKTAEKNADRILEDMNKNPHLFIEPHDADCYYWLSKIGCYSPIIHLQQTDGHTSAHQPFIEENNKKGIIKGEKVLRAIKESYENPVETDMPDRCDHIYLTLELFSGTTQTSWNILENYRKSVKYWRQFIPVDGRPLSELVSALQ